jgi:hypothetical protein
VSKLATGKDVAAIAGTTLVLWVLIEKLFPKTRTALGPERLPKARPFDIGGGKRDKATKAFWATYGIKPIKK